MNISKKLLTRLGIGVAAATLLVGGGIFVFQQTRYKVSEEEAKSIAVKNAGVRLVDANFVRVERDSDDWRVTYDIEFFTPEGDFDYVIDAETGSILERDNNIYATVQGATANNQVATSETSQVAPSANQTDATTQAPAAQAAPSTAKISQDEAKNKALADAGLAESAVTQLFVQMDMDNGVTYYEVDFNDPVTRTDYDYKVDANTGAIVERSQDSMLD